MARGAVARGAVARGAVARGAVRGVPCAGCRGGVPCGLRIEKLTFNAHYVRLNLRWILSSSVPAFEILLFHVLTDPDPETRFYGPPVDFCGHRSPGAAIIWRPWEVGGPRFLPEVEIRGVSDGKF